MTSKDIGRDDFEVDAEPEDPRGEDVERLCAELHRARRVRDAHEESVPRSDAPAHLFDGSVEEDLGLVGVERRGERFRHVLDEVVPGRGPRLEALALPLDARDAVEAKGAPRLLRWVPRDEVPKGANPNEAERLHPSVGGRPAVSRVPDARHHSFAARGRELRDVREGQVSRPITDLEHRAVERAEILPETDRENTL